MGNLTIGQAAISALLAGVSYLLLRILTLKPFGPLPIIGHLYHYGLRDRHSQAEWVLNALKYFKGKPWPLNIPGIIPKAYVISDPAMIKYVTLNKHLVMDKQGYFGNCVKELFAYGQVKGKSKWLTLVGKESDYRVIVATGEIWQAQRRAAHTFTTAETLDILTTKTLPRHLHIIHDTLDKAAETGEVVDLSQVITRCIFAVFGDIAWDVTWEELEPLSEVYDRALTVISWRFTIPAFRFWERIFPYGAQLRRDLEVIRSSAERLVKIMQNKVREEEIGEKEISPESGLLVRGLLKENLSDELMVDACITFANAGRGATSQAITWGLYELIKHPDLVERLRTDLENTSNLETANLVTQVPLLERIVSETVRFHPSVPFELVQLQPGNHPVALPNGPIIQPGTIIYWSPWATNRDTSVFGHDAGEFNPDRWEYMKKPSAYEMPTFYPGPRSCPGQQMARLEMAFVFADIVRRYDLLQAWEGERKSDEGIAGEMLGGLPVKVKRKKE